MSNNKCQCGEYMKTNDGDIKRMQQDVQECQDVEWKQTIREWLRDTKSWNKRLLASHKKFCLGDFEINYSYGKTN